MTIEEIQTLCGQLPEVTTDIKWEDHLCFNVCNKMFLVTSPDKLPPSASFKVTDEILKTLAIRRDLCHSLTLQDINGSMLMI